MSDRESLFSLEVVVDQLLLSSVTCRFPAVAFRLLDFPTLLVEHVEPQLAERIRNKISIEMQANLPRQMKELQDKNGVFLIKRGKSCLFKIPNEILRVHLSNTPLYVLVIDMFPATPKLVASCLIPLHDCMEKIHADIDKLGINVPHVHGEKGQYKVYNLMGIEVGHVDIACRLLSLGEGLMQHIPDHAIAKFGGEDVAENSILKSADSPRKKDGTPRKSGESPRTKDTPRMQKTPRQVVIQTPPKIQQDDLIVEDLEAPEKSQPIIISSAKGGKRDNISTSGTQTELPRKPKHVQFPPGDAADELNDLYVTNTYCPPPLFFNSSAEERLRPPKLEIYEYKSRPAGPFDVKDFDTESVRSDDALFDAVERGLDQTLVKPSQPEFVHYQYSLNPPASPTKRPDIQQMLASPDFLGGQFPFLRALTAELAFLQNGQVQPSEGEPPVKGPQQKVATPRSRSPRSGSPRTRRHASPHVLPQPVGKENREDFLARIAAPKKKQSEKQGIVPSNKGWLRKEPLCGQRKTKPRYSYGMTNTQRLRLAQVNPELLQSLELEQEDLKARQKEVPEQHVTNVQKAMAKTFVLQAAKNEMAVDSRTKVMPGLKHVRPVPAPRRISLGEDDSLKEVSQTELLQEAQRAQSQIPLDHPDITKLDEEESVSSDKRSGGSSQRSIKVHIPSVTMQESENYSYSSDEDSRPPSVIPDPGKKSKDTVTAEKPKGSQVSSTYPGFPVSYNYKPNDTQTTQKTESTLHYTDDFEDSKQWMSTDEPELVDLEYTESEETESRTLTEDASGDHDDEAVRTSTIRIPIVNPKASLNSPKTAIKKPASLRAAESTARTLEGESSTEKASSPTPKPRKSITPDGAESPEHVKVKRSVSFDFDDDLKPLPGFSRRGDRDTEVVSSVETSQGKPTPRRRPRSQSAESVGSSHRVKGSRSKSKLESIHTESVSSYVPSDPENFDLSDEYSDDFDTSEVGYQPSYVPSSQARLAKGVGRLGYTWN